ncbi:MAG TPA: GNAT family N-acetyltransferase [Planctomycetaceae bacterium]|nr:GNAT family N-acetyltransferase [Planctomycetaceae bacterium]
MNDEIAPVYRETRHVDAEAVLEYIRPFVTAKQLLPRTLQQVQALTRHGFVAEFEKRIVGFVAIEVYSRKMAEVQCLAVEIEMQGRGVGRRLVDFCVQRAADLGVVELIVISASDEFLLGCGFDYSLPDQKRALFLQPQLGISDRNVAAVDTASALWHDHIDTMRWPPHDAQLIETIDAHAAGEPLRVLLRGAPLVVGRTMLEKRRYATEHIDDLRRALMWEPRGHADMYGALLTAPTTEDGDLGVLFLHNDGFSTMCGHGIIALGTVLWETGMTTQDELKLDTPAGRINVCLQTNEQRAERVSFTNVPSFVDTLDHTLHVDGYGDVVVDIAFGGAYYAFCSAEAVGLTLTASRAQEIIVAGRAIKAALSEELQLRHPQHDDLGFLYGVIFTAPAVKEGAHSRHACIFANGELDRSPTGTGVSARAAILFQRGQIGRGECITIEGICDQAFDVEIVDVVSSATSATQSVVTRVGGTGHLTGRSQWVRRDNDPLRDGILIR